MFASFLASIRSRPYHERRILAVALFIASAAIVIALGVTSLASSMRLSSFEVVPDPTSIKETADAGSKAETLTSPFQALKQSFRDLVDGFKNVSDATHELVSAIEKNATATTTAPAYATSSPVLALAPPVVVSHVEPPPPKPSLPAPRPTPAPIVKKENLATIAATAYEPTSHDEEVRTLVTPKTEESSSPLPTGIIALLGTHAAAFLQTIQNAYNALRE